MRKLFSSLVFIVCISSAKTLIAQNVGIGTTTPSEKLHVAGNIKADTLKPNGLKITPNAGAGKLLTSDAAGNASWQDRVSSSNPGGAVGLGTWGDCSMNGISEYNPVTDTSGKRTSYFGWSSALSGEWAIIGSLFGPTLRGAIDFFHFDGSNWVFTQRFTDSTNGFISGLGYSVSISGNFAIAGTFDSVGENIGQGSANIYQLVGNTWVFKQKLTDPSGTALDQFGSSVSISGDNAVVGSYKDDVNASVDQGSASFFHFNGNSWVFVQKVIDATGAANDNFGNSVAISGNFAVVGSALDDIGSNTDQGSISIYTLNGNNWVLVKKMTDSTNLPIPGDNFGNSVSISGKYMAIGVPGAITNGKVQVLFNNGTNWVFQQDITSDIFSHSFGAAVSISGNYIIGGDLARTRQTNPPTSNSFGSAGVFTRAGIHWYPIIANISDPAGESNDQFGTSVGIDAATKRFVIGAPSFADQNGKAVFGKVN